MIHNRIESRLSLGVIRARTTCSVSLSCREGPHRICSGIDTVVAAILLGFKLQMPNDERSTANPDFIAVRNGEVNNIYSYFVRHLVQRLTMQILNRIEVMMVDTQKGSEKWIGKWPIKEAVQQCLTRMEAYDNQLRQIFKEAGTPVKRTVSTTCSIGSWRRNCCARGWPIDTWRPYLMDQASHC